MGKALLGKLALGAGLGALGMLTGKRGAGAENIGWDQQPTVLAQRGAALPMVIGRYEVAPHMLYAGDRRSKKSGGKKSTSKGAGRSYQEAGMLGVCTGAVDTLHQIRVDGGKVIYEGPLEASAGSGVTISTTSPNPGNLDVYFGEEDQPVNASLGRGEGAGTLGTGVESAWPHLCYLEPRRLALGDSPIWPTLRIEVERRLVAPLTESPNWLSAAYDKGGHNPAHALWALLTLPHPLGLGIPCWRLWCDRFEEVGMRCADEGLAFNYLAANAASGAQIIADILADAGGLMLEQDGLLFPRLVRIPDDDEIVELPVIDEGVIGDGGVRIVETDPPLRRNKVVFNYRDANHEYRDMPVPLQADGSIEISGQVRPTRIDLRAVTTPDVARTVADRRSFETLLQAETLEFRALRGASELRPGDAFILRLVGEPDRLCMVVGRDPEPLAFAAVLTCTVYQYGRRVFAFTPPIIGPPPVLPSLSPDLFFTPLELPYGLSRGLGDPDQARVALPRVRANDVSTGAVLLASDNAMTYAVLGQDARVAFGGELEDDLPVTRTIVDGDGSREDGPVILAFNDEVEDFEDLSDPMLANQWLAGRQVALIGEGADAEIVFIRAAVGLSPASSGRHRLVGLVRGRYDTQQRAWPVGTPLVVLATGAEDVRITPFPIGAAVAEGSEAYFKALPIGGSGEIDAGDIDAKTLVIEARAARPLPPLNARANDQLGAATYLTGEDVRITWDYRVRDGAGYAAGERGAGMATTMQPSRDGPFAVEILSDTGSGLELRRTITLDSDSTRPPAGGVLYTAVMNAADHGGSPASEFVARVWSTRGARRSRAAAVVTVTLE